MSTKLYVGKNFNSLVTEIEETYRSNYKILKQREVKKIPLLFWLKQYEIEIEVLEEKPPVAQQINQLNKAIHLNQAVQQAEARKEAPIDAKKKKLLELLEQNDGAGAGGKMKEAESSQLRDMKAMMEEIMKKIDQKDLEPSEEKESSYLGSEGEEVLLAAYEGLIDAEVLDGFAKQLIAEVKETLTEEEWQMEDVVRETLLASMTDRLKVTGALDLDEVQVMALIGPTGVGKTTTIAKIAGYMTDQQKKVGLITTDVYRIGATDQLQIYANILDSEMIAVDSPEELEAAIAKLKHEYKVDQILIDTVGRSPLDIGSIEDVREYLEAAEPDHVGLVLSSTQKTKDVHRILENFKSVPIESLLFTKLDETVNHGVMLNAVMDSEMKISFITNGQNVPYDIYQATSEALARKILNGVDDFGSSIVSA